MRTVSVEDFSRQMSAEPLSVVDIRPFEDYQGWHIEGKNVYTRHLDGTSVLQDAAKLSSLDADVPWVVVCALGETAKAVGEVMDRAGYDTTVLEGGMAAWNNHHHSQAITEQESFSLYQIQRPGKGCLSYLLTSGGEAMIFDPSQFIDVYQALLTQNDLTLKAVADTHVHADHITGGFFLSETAGVPFFRGQQSPGVQTLTNGQEFADGHVHVTALATPGHTPDSFAFLIAGRYLLTGDALFVSGVGRPDLGGHAREWGVDLYRSLEQLQTLPGDTVILPAHYGHWSEINAEGTVSGILRDLQENNPLLHESVETFLTHVESSANSETPPHYETIVAFNLAQGGDADASLLRSLEIGPNRCAAPPKP
jgi:glyoxylase-like metal-dependent hydrolase (beta-lactamase superfamily II)/rhodanese-related sulfurtransferase